MAKKKAVSKTKTVAVSNATYRNPIDAWLADALTNKEENGVVVNGKTALGYAPVWACINKIAGHVGYLPVHLYKRDKLKPKVVSLFDTHASYYAIASEPNAFMTAQTFKETITSHAILHGNGRAYMVLNGNGVANEFIPLPPETTKTFLVKFAADEKGMEQEGGVADVVAYQGGWEKWHVTTLSNGQKYYMPDSKVIHIPGLSYDGIQGYSVIELAKQALGLGMSAEKSALKHFSNGSRPSFFIKAPVGTFTKQDDANAFMDDFRKHHAGSENDGVVGMLRNGLDVATVQQNARDSQQNEQRMFQRQEVALLFAVEQILGDDSSVSYRSLEEKNRAYITNCLNRWLSKWEQELARKTLNVQQRRSMLYYYRFDDWELTRGTMIDRFQAYQIGRQAEILSSNECREFEDLEPRAGGDEYKNPAINPSEPTKQADKAPANDPATKAIASRIGHLINVEKNRIRQYADGNYNFVHAVDKFYDGWNSKFLSVVQELGGDDVLAHEWTASNKSSLIKMAGEATKENLKQAVEQRLGTWAEREQSLINNIKEIANV